MEETLFQIFGHIDVINAEMGQVQVSIAVLETQMESVIYWGRLGVGALAVLLITQGVQIFQIKRNGKR